MTEYTPEAERTDMNKNIIDADAATLETALRALIEKHGKAAVLAELDNLADMTGFADWQRVVNIAKNVSNRIEREKAAGYVRCPDHRNGGATMCPRGGPALQEFQRRMWDGI